MCEICSRLTRKTPEGCSDISIVDLEQDLLVQNLLTGSFDVEKTKENHWIYYNHTEVNIYPKKPITITVTLILNRRKNSGFDLLFWETFKPN